MDDVSSGAGVAGGDGNDDGLLAELRSLAARHDPITPEAVAAARSAIAWRTIDAELAELTSETEPENELSGVRGSQAPVLLTFSAPSLTVEVDVLETATARRLLGQLVPPAAGAVEVRHAAGTTMVAVDDVGRFKVDGVAPGPVSLRCSTDSAIVQTDWFLA